MFRRWSFPLAFLIPGTIILLEFINSIVGFGEGLPFPGFLGNWFEFDLLKGDFATDIFIEPTQDVSFELLKLILSQMEWLSMGVGVAVTTGVNAYAFPGAVIISDEYSGLAFLKRHRSCHIRAPHCIDGLWNNGAIMCL